MVYTKLNPSLSNQYADTALYQAFDQGIYDAHNLVGITPESLGASTGGIIDATAQVQDAADAATSLGIPLRLTDGKTYLIGASITGQCDVVGRGTLKFDPAASTGSIIPLLDLSGNNRVVCGPAFDCAYTLHTHAVRLSNSINPKISSCIFNKAWVQIDIASNVVDTKIISNRFIGSGFGVIYDDHPLQAGSIGSTGLKFLFNEFNGEQAGPGGDCLEINSPAYGFSDLWVIGNKIKSLFSLNPVNGLGIGLAGVQRGLVAYNGLEDTWHNGIHIETGIVTVPWNSSTAYASGTSVTNASKAYMSTASISAGGVAPTHTSGTVNNWLYLGVPDTFGPSKRMKVTRNLLRNPGTLDTVKHSGITTVASYVDVDYNDVYGAGLEGIELYAGQGYTGGWLSDARPSITYNKVAYCGNNGIANLGFPDAKLRGNDVHDCSQRAVGENAGILLYIEPNSNVQTPDNSKVEHNDIAGSRHHSHIHIMYGTNITERNNTLGNDAINGAVVVEGTAGSVVRGEPYAAVQDVNANGFTIALSYTTKIYPLTAGASRTGVILPAGTFDKQEITLINRSGTNTIQFAAAATSRVADGTATTLAVNRAYKFVWDSGAGASGLWFRSTS